jgi:hypothetical protein
MMQGAFCPPAAAGDAQPFLGPFKGEGTVSDDDATAAADLIFSLPDEAISTCSFTSNNSFYKKCFSFGSKFL